MNKTISIVLVVVLVLSLAVRIANADFTFGTPTNLGPTINSSANNDCPSISADGLSLYFTSEWPGGYGSADLWVATRATKDEDWGIPVNLGPTINSSSDDFAPSISADGLFLYFTSERPGGSGNYDLWVTTRDTKDDEWGPPMNLGPTVNTGQEDACACISADGLSLYFNSGPAGTYIIDLWVTTRATTDDDWSDPVNLGPVVNSSSGYQEFPSISADGRILFFSSNRPGGIGDEDIWMTRRATISDPWGTPLNLGPPVNTSGYDKEPSISADGLTLYFASNGSGVWGIWQVSIEPVVDLNGDGIVDSADMCIMVDHWGTDEPLCDIGPMPWGDGIVDVQDLIVLAEHLFEDYRLIAHWELDETEGMFAADSAGDNDAFVVGGASWQPGSGQVDGALQLNGVDGCAIASPVLNPANGSFSILAWVNGGAPGQVVVSQQGAANWLTADAEGNLMTELKGTGRSVGPLFSETVITDGQWHRIGLVWDGSNRTLYVDDVAVAEDIQPGLEGSQMHLYIGAGKNYTPGTFWSGLIDDVRIYNVALSSEHIEALAQ